MLCFETLTLAPIDRTLVDLDLLEDDEIAWLDAYHARVRETIAPLVDPDTRSGWPRRRRRSELPDRHDERQRSRANPSGHFAGRRARDRG